MWQFEYAQNSYGDILYLNNCGDGCGDGWGYNGNGQGSGYSDYGCGGYEDGGGYGDEFWFELKLK
jgi:hypothetical protein